MGVLDGKVALITGAGQGVGAGMARALAKEGARIAVVGRTESKLVETCAAIADFGGVAEPFVCDISKREQLGPMVARVVEVFGGIDILINNANASALGPLLEVTPKLLDRAMAVGPVATLFLMQLCHPHLKARGGGSIVNLVSSSAVRWDTSGYGLYAATKEAMRSLTRTAASEWGADGIRVNAIAPHALSPGLQWWTENNPEEAAEFVRSIPLGRIGDCEQDIGRAVVFLVGPDAGYLTGATIPLDGGQARWS